jgi:hypothetical protein
MIRSTLGAFLGGSTRGGQYGFDCAALRSITPPNFWAGRRKLLTIGRRGGAGRTLDFRAVAQSDFVTVGRADLALDVMSLPPAFSLSDLPAKSRSCGR